MQEDVPLVIPEVNGGPHQADRHPGWRKKSGGYVVTNPNCSAIGLVIALAPLHQQFGLETVMAVTMQAVSGAGYPGVASLDILGNVIPYIRNEEEKMEEETRKLLGQVNGTKVVPGDFAMSAQCNRVAVEDGHTESISIRLRKKATAEEIIAAWNSLSQRASGIETAQRAGTSHHLSGSCGPSATALRRRYGRWHDHRRRTPSSLRSAGLEVHRSLAQHDSRCRGRSRSQRRIAQSQGISGMKMLRGALAAAPSFRPLRFERFLRAPLTF